MESDPVQLFCAANGLESREDFAFLFETREEAHAEGGPMARRECSEGLAVKVRDIYAMQAASAKASMPAPPSASSAAKPTSAPRVARRKHKSDLDLVARNAEFRTVLVDILVAGSKYSSQLWSDAATGVVRTIVGKPLASAEPSTLARVCSTWRELKQYCAGHGYVIHSLTALQVARPAAESCLPLLSCASTCILLPTWSWPGLCRPRKAAALGMVPGRPQSPNLSCCCAWRSPLSLPFGLRIPTGLLFMLHGCRPRGV